MLLNIFFFVLGLKRVPEGMLSNLFVGKNYWSNCALVNYGVKQFIYLSWFHSFFFLN